MVYIFYTIWNIYVDFLYLITKEKIFKISLTVFRDKIKKLYKLFERRQR